MRRTLMSSLLRPGTSAVMVKRWSSSSTCTGGRRAAAVARLGRPASACTRAPVQSTQSAHPHCPSTVNWDTHSCPLDIRAAALARLGRPASACACIYY